MTALLRLAKADYLPSEQMPVAVAERTSQPSFPPHVHEFKDRKSTRLNSSHWE